MPFTYILDAPCQASKTAAVQDALSEAQAERDRQVKEFWKYKLQLKLLCNCLVNALQFLRLHLCAREGAAGCLGLGEGRLP
jgi:hypothetical protein